MNIIIIVIQGLVFGGGNAMSVSCWNDGGLSIGLRASGMFHRCTNSLTVFRVRFRKR